MSYITREDGERFVIPSYRDVLSAKKPALLRKEILLLSSNYGEYITLQRKNINQYEVAFSLDSGYLLGETVWHYFKRPQDLIYCEAIPNTSEVILVIVKSGSVYLDGTFPSDAILDELVIFLSQQNNFEVYIHGDVPISETPEQGKFSLNERSIKSFTILEDPVFPVLPTVKAFQLQLVDAVLKSKGIGVFPAGKWIAALAVLLFAWMVYWFFSRTEQELPQIIVEATNPYQQYIISLASPDPAAQIHWIANNVHVLLTIPGWKPESVDFENNKLRALVRSQGVMTTMLYDWAKKNNATIEISTIGFYVVMDGVFANRRPPTNVMVLNKQVATLLDNLSYLFKDNVLTVGELTTKGRYGERELTIKFTDITPLTLDSIGQKLKDLSLVLIKVSIKMNNGNLTGSITLKVLGS